MGDTLPGSLDVWCWRQKSKPKDVVTKSSGVHTAVSGFPSGIIYGRGVSLLVWAYLLILGLNRGYTIFYLDPSAATKALLSVNGCQIAVEQRDMDHHILIDHVADITLQNS